MWRFVVRFLLLLVAALPGCGSPTSPAPLPTAIAITPADDLLTVKTTLTFKAAGTFADGSARTIDARWLTDNPAVATVNAGGMVTGVGTGSTTLIVTAGDRTASRVLRVVPDFTGSWSGQSQITGCSAGDPRTCGRSYPVGQTHTMDLTLTQARDLASGTLQLDAPATPTTLSYIGPVSGPVQLRIVGQKPLPKPAFVTRALG